MPKMKNAVAKTKSCNLTSPSRFPKSQPKIQNVGKAK